MGETADQIKQQVELARGRLDHDLTQLEYRVRAEADWRVQYSRHPWAFAGAAFVLSLFTSLMIFGSRRGRAGTQ